LYVGDHTPCFGVVDHPFTGYRAKGIYLGNSPAFGIGIASGAGFVDFKRLAAHLIFG
jgi:hypothetical protein